MKPLKKPLTFDVVEEEWGKDIWDARRIPGARYHLCGSQHWLNFMQVPPAFRPIVKRYLRLLVLRYSLAHCIVTLHALRLFCLFWQLREPDVSDFLHLTRPVMEDFIVYLKTTPNTRKAQRRAGNVSTILSCLQRFLEHLERSDASEVPRMAVGKLIWPTDMERHPTYRNERTVKYIPESVLEQLDRVLSHIRRTSFPVVFVLRASGWRVSDVLSLRYDTCLEKTESGWWLCGDISKTRVLNHRVPISPEVAAFIQAQSETVKTQYALEDNPQRLLFPAPSRKRRGLPIHAETVQHALNALAHKYQICDETGALFHFHVHAFRHTKAVELINNGMSLLLVQKWMAHATPEMTLVYAKLLDPTMRKAWEEAFAQGAVRIDGTGMPHAFAPEKLGDEQTIEWEYLRHNLDAVRLPNGYCFKPKKAECPTQATPCYACHHFCTTTTFLPQFEQEERDMRQLIAMGEQVGSVPWVERNQQKLDRLLPVIHVLREGKLHHPAGKAVREYTGKERAEQHGE